MRKTESVNHHNKDEKKHRISLEEFIKKTGRKPLETDEEGNAIIDINEPKQRRWLED